MEIKNFLKHTIKGVLYALAITLVLVLVFSIVTTKFEFSESVNSIANVVMTCLSLVVGSVIAAKSHGSRGWMIGFAVGIVYYIALYLVALIFGESAKLGMYDFYRFLMSIGAGTLAGMLGINL